MKDGNARKIRGKRASDAARQNLVDSGEAATLEEAGQILAKRARDAARQNLVDSGEAATLEEARKILGKRRQDAARQNLVDSGKAATRNEGAPALGVIALTNVACYLLLGWLVAGQPQPVNAAPVQVARGCTSKSGPGQVLMDTSEQLDHNQPGGL